MLESLQKKHSQYHGVKPLKRYSQNFITDPNLCDKIARHANFSNHDTVLEIGPGTGELTKSIINYSPKSFIVIELDSRCIPLLHDIKNSTYPKMEIIHEDALNLDLSNIIRDKLHIISNLPYSIGTTLILKWIKHLHLIHSMTLMFQKEVAERIYSKPHSKSYGRLSVICQLLCNVEKLFDIDKCNFYPIPNVDSTLIKLTPKNNLLSNDLINMIETITSIAFNQRRKMIKSSLKSLHPNILGILNDLSINPQDRAENLSTESFLSLAENLLNKNTIYQ
ncbi:MAG: 16S rRNA (adenine(1518)-N(6)/adenine(1519)-N(6))-dimethyltransferase RsmA [Rickettsiaceae bacterium]